MLVLIQLYGCAIRLLIIYGYNLQVLGLCHPELDEGLRRRLKIPTGLRQAVNDKCLIC